MNGDIGAWFIGKEQVGGFWDWDIDIDLKEVSTAPTRKYIFHKWRARVKSLWFERRFTECQARFYQGDLIWETIANLSLPDIPFNVIVDMPFEFEGKEVLCRVKQ